MARVKGGYLGGTYDIPKKQPLDSRMLVTKRVDLINPSVWKTNGSTTGESGHYNGMIVSVNSDGVYNGVYYLIDRTAITAENYSAYKIALDAGEDINPYFSMWVKLGSLDDIATIEKNLTELIGEIPEGKTIVDMIAEVKPSMNLVPVDGSLIIKDNTIDIGISAEPGNALTKKADGLYVGTSTSGNYAAGLGLTLVDGTFSVKLAENTHGLVAVDGALMLNLATKDSDGAMSKEDKVFLDALKALNISTEYATKEEVQVLRESVAELAQAYVWEEI